MIYSRKAPMLLLMILLTIVSCKKKDEEADALEYMTGVLASKVPQYLTKNTAYTFKAIGITDPTEGITYTWTAEGFSPDSVDTQEFTCVSPDTSGTYTVTVVASKEGYNSVTSTQTVIVIEKTYIESIRGLTRGTDSIVDPRDNNKYYIRIYGKLEWFVHNLNWAGAGFPYGKFEALGIPLGRLYSWNEATSGMAGTGLGQGPQGVCPPGWTVPTPEDWSNFATANNAGQTLSFFDNWNNLAEPVCAYAKLNDLYMWPYSPKNLKTNTTAWNGLPTGYSTNNGNNYTGYGVLGIWWSSGQQGDSNGLYRYINYDVNQFPYQHVDKSSFGASVRCVRLVSSQTE